MPRQARTLTATLHGGSQGCPPTFAWRRTGSRLGGHYVGPVSFHWPIHLGPSLLQAANPDDFGGPNPPPPPPPPTGNIEESRRIAGRPPPLRAGPYPSEAARGDAQDSDHRRTRTPFMVVPRSAAIQAVEDELGPALVAIVGGTRPQVSVSMVYDYLLTRFDITADEVEVRRHHPEEFVARFRHGADRERVLSSRPGGALLPLVWYPWRRTSGASAGAFRFKVLLAMSRLPLHARSEAVAQVIVGPSYAKVEATQLRDVPVEDDREFFVTAWCWHPNFILDKHVIFIPEPSVHGVADNERSSLSGLRYLVRIRLVAY